MSDFTGPGPQHDGVIRITDDDVRSAHVDDLLKRQASLRGEQGITANRKRKWYYRNWFVFMLAGICGAVLAWGISEPHFDDMLYVQGKIESVRAYASPQSRIDLPGRSFVQLDGDLKCLGEMTVNGDQIYVLTFTLELCADGENTPLDMSAFAAGQEVGLYVELVPVEDLPVEFPVVVLADLTPPSRAEPTGRLSQLSAASVAGSMLLFPLVASMIGLFIAAADGIVCRLLRRVLIAGVIGLLVGFIGGFLSQILAGLVYGPLNALAMEQQVGFGELTTMGFLTQMTGRGLAWCLAGMAMGLGQGIYLRSGRLLLCGFLGGAIGGLFGGLLFDPIDLLLLGADKPSSYLARLIGFAVIGAGVGIMIGVVELLARDAWLRMVEGPLAGKEFLIFKDTLQVGASPRSDIYLFNDNEVAERHAVIRATADHYEIEAVDQARPVLLNGRSVQRARMRHGDQIGLGRTVFSFHRRRTD